MSDKEEDHFREEFRHELNSRWTTEQLRELIESVNRERDRRYDDKFKSLEEKIASGFVAAKEAVAAALVAAKELVANSFESSKQAIAKAEISTEKRFESVNEFRAQLKDQQLTLMPRVEADGRFKSLVDKVEMLERRAERDSGGDAVVDRRRSQLQWIIGLIVTLIAIFGPALIYVIIRLNAQPQVVYEPAPASSTPATATYSTPVPTK